ncbi:type II toxin-antitoxin system RelE/ParE family toxin [Bradyrhizobium sp.]
MILEWSAAALADLDRFAEFLHDRHPTMAQVIAVEILNRTRIISEHPQLGRPIDGREDYRELVLSVLNTTYVFRYGYDGERLVMLRVFDGREQRDT